MSSRSMSIVAFLTIWPSVPFPSPSIAVICAHEEPVESKKDKANNLYPRDFASMLKPPQKLISNFKHTTEHLIRSTGMRADLLSKFDAEYIGLAVGDHTSVQCTFGKWRG